MKRKPTLQSLYELDLIAVRNPSTNLVIKQINAKYNTSKLKSAFYYKIHACIK